jgi:galactokinase
MNDVAERLAAAGISSAETASKARLFAAAEAALPGAAAWRWHVPGRIEVLGKHTDYAGGPSLLCATERGLCVVATPRDDARVTVSDASRNRRAEFALSADIGVACGWENYVATVVRRIARNFPGAQRGVAIAFASDLPQASGLSSSSALIVAIFVAIAAANRLAERAEFATIARVPEELAAYAACLENGHSFGALVGDRGVGTFGGSEDHTAIFCCRAGQLSQYRFCPVGLERRIALPQDWTFVVGSSGVRASKTGDAQALYNRVSLAAQAVLDAWNARSRRGDASLDAPLRTSPDTAEQIRAAIRDARVPGFTADELLRRFEHYRQESQELVPAAAEAFARGDAQWLGEIVDRSQQAGEELLGNQVPETIALARSARRLGAIAASAFGAGFGGSVWALIARDRAGEFLPAWRECYAREFPAAAPNAEFFLSAAGPGLTLL